MSQKNQYNLELGEKQTQLYKRLLSLMKPTNFQKESKQHQVLQENDQIGELRGVAMYFNYDTNQYELEFTQDAQIVLYDFEGKIKQQNELQSYQQAKNLGHKLHQIYLPEDQRKQLGKQTLIARIERPIKDNRISIYFNQMVSEREFLKKDYQQLYMGVGNKHFKTTGEERVESDFQVSDFQIKVYNSK